MAGGSLLWSSSFGHYHARMDKPTANLFVVIPDAA
jgi:hypothetical protein